MKRLTNDEWKRVDGMLKVCSVEERITLPETLDVSVKAGDINLVVRAIADLRARAPASKPDAMTVTERGWCGHIHGIVDCRFRRNTLVVGPDGVDIVVLTVGNRRAADGQMAEIGAVGSGVLFKTTVYQADTEYPFRDAVPGTPPLDIPGGLMTTIHVDPSGVGLASDVDVEANDMHDAVVRAFVVTVTEEGK